MKFITRIMTVTPLVWVRRMRAVVTTQFRAMDWIAIVMALLIVTAPNAYAKIYKWIDADGKVQYSRTPPPEGQFNEVKPGPPPGESPDAANRELQDHLKRQEESENQDEADKMAKKEMASKQAKLEQDCGNTRSELTKLENNSGPRLSVMENGEMVRGMSEDERQSRIAEAKKFISENCQ
jgi:hypothetical protein